MGSNPTPGATKQDSEQLIPDQPQYSTPNTLTVNSQERPVLLSLDGRGFYVIHYTAIPEDKLTRIRFDLADPNNGEGATAEALVDPKLLETLNQHSHGQTSKKALLIWIDTQANEVRWQLRKIDETLSASSLS